MLLQGGGPNILGTLVKGFKAGKTNQNMDFSQMTQSNFSHLEGVFMKNPLHSELSPTKEVLEELELDIGNIPSYLSSYFFMTDIILCPYLFSISVFEVPLTEDLLLTQMILKSMTLSLWLLLHLITHKIAKEVTYIKLIFCTFRIHNNKYFPVYIAGTEREKLLDSVGDDAKPRPRTREEIIAKYRKTGVVIFVIFMISHSELYLINVLIVIFNPIYIFQVQDASSAAGQARDKLLERQEKLEVG